MSAGLESNKLFRPGEKVERMFEIGEWPPAGFSSKFLLPVDCEDLLPRKGLEHRLPDQIPINRKWTFKIGDGVCTQEGCFARHCPASGDDDIRKTEQRTRVEHPDIV
jgi:hypothetical protein